MLEMTLYKKEMKSSLKMLVIFTAIITLYVSVIISIYDPQMKETLEQFYKTMPEMMSAMGMNKGENTLLGFMVSYLYGFILIVFPMVFSILRANSLIAKYTDRGSMAILLAAPIKRSTVVKTQMSVLLTGILFLVVYATALEYFVAEKCFPGELNIADLIRLNAALLMLHLFIGGICFLSSCIFSETKYSIAFGAGVPALMYVLQMLANAGENTEFIKYMTFFTLFNPEEIALGADSAMIGPIVMLAGAVLMYVLSIRVFCRKDLHI